MTLLTRRGTILGCIGCTLTAAAVAAVLSLGTGRPLKAEEPKADAQLERTRAQAKMLDDVLKVAVVDITKRYNGPPAAKVAQEVLRAADQKGYFSGRLVDVTGSPLNESNEPKSDFEKRAAEAIKKGEAYYEEVVTQGKDRRLLVATALPAVIQKCAKCHGVEEGDLLGFLHYNLPVK